MHTVQQLVYRSNQSGFHQVINFYPQYNK